MPSGLGLSGRSQASVQSLRNIRAGLPVNERLRTVSRLLAFTYAACCAGVFEASSTINHWDPVHTPWAPSANAAAICCPLPIPPAANIGTGAISLTTWGHRTIEPTSPQWPPASPPCAITMSTP